MKITRYINGKKINKAIDSEYLISQPIVANTIETVNHRLKIKKEQSNG